MYFKENLATELTLDTPVKTQTLQVQMSDITQEWHTGPHSRSKKQVGVTCHSEKTLFNKLNKGCACV